MRMFWLGYSVGLATAVVWAWIVFRTARQLTKGGVFRTAEDVFYGARNG